MRHLLTVMGLIICLGLASCQKKEIGRLFYFDWGVCEMGAEAQQVVLKTNRQIWRLSVNYLEDGEYQWKSVLERGAEEASFSEEWFSLEIRNGETCQITIRVSKNEKAQSRIISFQAEANLPMPLTYGFTHASVYQSPMGGGKTQTEVTTYSGSFFKDYQIFGCLQDKGYFFALDSKLSYSVKDDFGVSYLQGEDGKVKGDWFTVYSTTEDRTPQYQTLQVSLSPNETGEWRTLRIYVDNGKGVKDAAIITQMPN